jgi:hypothetical protein
LKHDPDKLTLRHELANLYFMLQRYKDAENVLVDMLVKMDKSQELSSLINEVKIFLLLSQVQKLNQSNKFYNDFNILEC